MKISLQELLHMRACNDLIKRFKLQTNGTQESVDVATLVGGHNTYQDLLWLAGKKLDRKRIVRFTLDCALINIELLKPYTNRYDLLVDWLKDPTDDTIDVARTASVYADDRSAYAAAVYAAAQAAYATAGYESNYHPVYYATYAAVSAAKINEASVNTLLAQLFNEAK